MRSPVFSIITPTFKRPDLLKRNIKSVINQTYENYEHIIIDDANEQETAGIINSFNDNRIVLLHHEIQKGAAASYNTGIRASKGDFIVFLDDDDEYMPCFLKKMNERFLHSKPETGFIWTGISRIRQTDKGNECTSSVIWPSHFSIKEEGLIAATSIGNGYGVCIRKKCFDIIGFYDETITCGQDTEFLFRLARTFEFETIPEALVKIHTHNHPQLTDDNNNKIRLELREKILLQNQDILRMFPKLYYVHYQVVADLCYKLNLKKKGRRIMISIIKYSPFNFLNFTDLIFYEISGKNTKDSYRASTLRTIIQLLKRN